MKRVNPIWDVWLVANKVPKKEKITEDESSNLNKELLHSNPTRNEAPKQETVVDELDALLGF